MHGNTNLNLGVFGRDNLQPSPAIDAIATRPIRAASELSAYSFPEIGVEYMPLDRHIIIGRVGEDEAGGLVAHQNLHRLGCISGNFI
jgi:hypothetical protein